MSDHTQQPQPWGAPQPDQPKPKHAKGTGRVAVAIYAAIGGIILGGLSAQADTTGGGTATPGPTVTVTAAADVPAEEPAEEEPAEPTYGEPKKQDFELTVKTLNKDCFGSAGCLVEVRIELGYDGQPLDPAKTYEVTYDVTGGETPTTNTIQVTGDQYEPAEEMIDTPSSETKIRAEITSISEY